MASLRRIPVAWLIGAILLLASTGASPPAPAAASRASVGPEQVERALVQTDELVGLVRGLSVEEKVGQLLLLGFSGNDAEGARPAIAELHAGGVALLQNATSADAARGLTAELQTLARQNGALPLLIAIDHEGGPVQRLRTGVTSLGANWQVGQLRPLDRALEAARARGTTHGQELANLGINMNLAPDLDVWDNPHNTVIGQRSYSADPDVVAALGATYIEALQGEGVLAVGKHFPGHGSTDEDSHLTLPLLAYDQARLDAVELLPFRRAIEAHVAGIMTAHVSYPALDSVPDRPASLSPAIVTDLLRGRMGYEGLVLTDDMGAMLAITGRYDAGDAAVQAVVAGADLLIVVGPLERQRQTAAALISEVGRAISMERLDASVLRVLHAKQQAGLSW